ncbi:MAG: metallophosphoesterase [Burkholderiaceae bacterium]
MASLLQISDTHFGTEVPEVVAALRRLNAEIEPDLLVISGDITQRATRAQFKLARAFVDSLAPQAVLALPGNHDVPLINLALRMVDPFRRFRAAFGHVLEPVHDSESMLVIGVNTVRPRWHKDGAVSPLQIARVADRLAAARVEQLRIVVTHQPIEVIRPQDRPNRLVRAEAAAKAWVAAGADLVLGGHIHLPYFVSLRDRFPGLDRNAWLAQAGTALSSRIRGGIPNSVNVVRTGTVTTTGTARRSSMTIERWDFDALHKAFRLGQERSVDAG